MIDNTLKTLADKLKAQSKTIITDKCLEEIEKILDNKCVYRDFALTLQKDIERFNEHREEYLRKTNLFERLNLNSKQNEKKKGKENLCSYNIKKIKLTIKMFD